MSKFLTRETPHIEIRGDYYYKEENSGETDKLDIGAECNRLIHFAERFDGIHSEQIVKDIRSIVARVEEFEEIDRE